jgi:hypothetical protein
LPINRGARGNPQTITWQSLPLPHKHNTSTWIVRPFIHPIIYRPFSFVHPNIHHPFDHSIVHLLDCPSNYSLFIRLSNYLSFVRLFDHSSVMVSKFLWFVLLTDHSFVMLSKLFLFSSPTTCEANILVMQTPIIMIFLLMKTSRLVTHFQNCPKLSTFNLGVLSR